jgi:predicted nucleotidyltransferase
MARKSSKARNSLIASLRERAKELNCLYRVDEILNRGDLPVDEALAKVVKVIAPGWQFPEICEARITCEKKVYKSADFTPTPWVLTAKLVVQDNPIGELSIYYTEERPEADEGPFLKEEVRLANSIAERLSQYVFYRRLKTLHDQMQGMSRGTGPADGWRGPIQLLRQSDRNLYVRIARKMVNHLLQTGVEEARALLPEAEMSSDGKALFGEQNVPGPRRVHDFEALLSMKPFELASDYLSDDEILSRVQRWIQEDKASVLLKVVSNPRSSVPEITEALQRYQHVVTADGVLSQSTISSLRVTLTQRLLTEQLDFVRVAKGFVEITDFLDVVDRIIVPADSHGKLGGKGAGLFLAHRIVARKLAENPEVGEVRVPRTWYVASDAVLDFISHSDLEDVVEQKYKPIEQVRQEYPNVVHLFKSSSFPPDVIKGLSMALDDLGEVPLIVRSSSLLEDRLGTAFSGKYRSLFLANQGTKKERLEALTDAIAEVYSSVFSPDPIEYRREHGLLDFNEEMGILIQEVIGKRVGKYFFPAFSGVAFSNNEFRWSPRIKREDGLIRMVPGLGTRAVDRVPDDYPILIVPGQPKLRVNQAMDEIMRYAPKKVDVINMESRTLETVDLRELLEECGAKYPAFDRVFSVLRDEILQKPVGLLFDSERDEVVATFDGLLSQSDFVRQFGAIMKTLKESLDTPVDIEFAHDGDHFYLLQCRPQSYAEAASPSPIPKDVPDEDILFSAHRYVSNGHVPDITHVVYVDPERYTELGGRADLLSVARAVGRLNTLLPKRQFILMGPGRWGSRGDLKLGVGVTYADISNTAMLIEIARRKGQYVPDVSFGTHFFQDLVESRISYLPLYPDDGNVIFNERFLRSANNLLPDLLPQYEKLVDTLRVIEVPAETGERILRVLLNADLDEALALFTTGGDALATPQERGAAVAKKPVHYWRWRKKMAERMALDLDAERYGVVAMYIFGSVKNATPGPASDIDLLVHFRGSESQRRELLSWFEGWSLSLDEMNYLRTGYRSGGLLDVHIVTDEDIEQKSSYASKIGAVTDAARPLPLKRTEG